MYIEVHYHIADVVIIDSCASVRLFSKNMLTYTILYCYIL